MVYGSIYDGTLMGQWPAAAVFASILPLADKNGNIDLNPKLIAYKTGWPPELLTQGIEQLMQPDPHSRSKDKEGRRLELIDPNRPWGWHVVNHQLYREKSRLAEKNALYTQSGKDAERKRKSRNRSIEAADNVATPAAPPAAPLPSKPGVPSNRLDGATDNVAAPVTAPTAPPPAKPIVSPYRLNMVRRFLGTRESRKNVFFDSVRDQLPHLTDKQCFHIERSPEFKAWQEYERYASGV
jgi:hypothetical protein